MKASPRAKAAMVDFGNLDAIQAIEMSKPRLGTAPGQAMQNVVLRSQLEQWEGASPVRHIDPNTILRSKWANLHEESFKDADFKKLKDDIESAGGNVQPIKVRPAIGREGFYEVIYGHRRHQACLDLGFLVLAMISDANDQQMFVEMDRENRQRKDLRPYEQGLMYKKALDDKLFFSAKKLAEASGVAPSNLGMALALARLPLSVLDAFISPLDLQYRWAADLTKALELDTPKVLATALAIKNESPRPASKIVFERLIGGGNSVLPPESKIIPITGSSGQSASMVLSPAGKKAVVSLTNIDPKRFAALQKLIQDFLG